MYSIGDLSRQTGVRVPTIRYYEQSGLLTADERTTGNQRRYSAQGLEKLAFIKHARDLGFSIEAITALIGLQYHPDRSCKEATDLAQNQLIAVKNKIEQLQSLEVELQRIAKGCSGAGLTRDCYVLASLADHAYCKHDH